MLSNSIALVSYIKVTELVLHVLIAYIVSLRAESNLKTRCRTMLMGLSLQAYTDTLSDLHFSFLIACITVVH